MAATRLRPITSNRTSASGFQGHGTALPSSYTVSGESRNFGVARVHMRSGPADPAEDRWDGVQQKQKLTKDGSGSEVANASVPEALGPRTS